MPIRGLRLVQVVERQPAGQPFAFGKSETLRVVVPYGDAVGEGIVVAVDGTPDDPLAQPPPGCCLRLVRLERVEQLDNAVEPTSLLAPYRPVIGQSRVVAQASRHAPNQGIDPGTVAEKGKSRPRHCGWTRRHPLKLTPRRGRAPIPEQPVQARSFVLFGQR